MGIRFTGGNRLQRGRGIAGLLKIAKSLFNPGLKTAGKALQSNTAKAIGHALKEQAIESGTHLLSDALIGNDLKEGLNW